MDDRRCAARARSGDRCHRLAARGATVCEMHGARARQVAAAAQRRLESAAAAEAVVTFGLPAEVDPQQALLDEVHRTAGHVERLSTKIASLPEDEFKQGDVTGRFERPSVWVEMYQADRSGRRLGTMSWGLVPSWSEDPTSGPRPINARAETLLDKPMFAEPFRRRRCIVPVDGFYEWRQTEQGKEPHFISATDGNPLALAGLWDRWVGADGAPLVTCTIVTTEANDVVAPLHDRMPAIVQRNAWDAWLGAGGDAKSLTDLLQPAPEALLEVHAVSRLVNSVVNDGPELLSGVARRGEEWPN